MKHPRLLRLDHRLRFALVALTVTVALMTAMFAPHVAMAASFTVTKTSDTNDGACNADCSLREAIVAANAAAGADTITLPAGTYTLTISGIDNAAAQGDLDVTGPLTINRAGQGSTIIQAGANTSAAIDRVFSFNPTGSGTGFAVSLNNLTIRNGKDPNAFATFEGDGGCFDFDGGTNGAGSLSLSSVTVSNCATTDGDGGGTAVFLGSGGTVTINNSTIQNNITARSSGTPGNGGGLAFFCVNNGATANVSISNSTIQNNSTGSSSSTVIGNGGGLFFFGSCSTPSTANVNYQLHALTLTGNSADSDGGGIYSTAPLTIDNVGGPTVISGNTSGRSGGGIWLNHNNQTSTISKVTITGNQAADGGGGIRLDSASPGNALNLSFSRIVNNTAASGKATGLSVYNGTANAVNNWWGCSTGPSAAPCDTAKVDPASGTTSPPGGGSVTFNPGLRVLTTATPATILTNQTTSLLASFNTNSNGQDVSANIDVLKGLPVTWSAVGGNITASQGTIQANGTATATYQATAAGASNRAAAKVDNDGTTTGSNVVSITVNKAGTTTSITGDSPDPTVTGQSYTVSYNVVSATGSTPTAPSGSVTVSDGTSTCTGTVAAGQCTLTSTTAGAKTLTATYAGDANFLTSTAAGVAHTVNKADTTTMITADTPDPSVVGQAVTINYSVSVNAPGAGTPTGNVTVSDGTQSCTATVAAGTCSITFTTAGAKTLTATYAGDANFNSSTSASQAHTVNPANTTTTITSDNPDPSAVGQAVVVQYTVTANAPGAGTPTGNVTVSDGADSCTATVAAGQCTITLTTAGSHTLTATYAGDSNFNGSSDTEAHTVNVADLTIAKTHTGNFSQGQTGAQYTITVSNGGTGATNGTVTVVDTLPTGLTATAISGTGWTCDLATLTCTRSDALAAGSSYPDITLTVDVAANAPASVTNTVTVSGGGEQNTGNDSASDPTTINAVDTTKPSVMINQAVGQADPTGTSPINFTVVFDEPVTGFTSSDVNLSGTAGATTAVVTEVAPNDGTTYNVAVSGMTGSGTVIASIPAGAAQDTAGNTSNASTSTDNTVTYNAPTPDLTIAKTHTGNFAQGQTGAQYTITVSNGGTGTTNGTVTVVDNLPTGLTATAISGTGWSCTLATLTCTRSDTLAAGSSYPDITLTVDVAANAPTSVTNTATVSGGGETNTGNDTANDQTTIGTVDSTKPSVTINQAAGQADPTSTSPINFTVVFDEPVTGFTNTDVTLSGTAGATTATVSGSGTTYNVAVSGMTSNGTVIATIPAGAAQDGAGNTSNASTSTDNTVTYNAAPPTAPDLTITKSHSGNFAPGQTGAQYAITVKNNGNASSSGTVTVVDTLPTGLTATAISGSGWSCTLGTLTCTRSDALTAGSSYPAITLTVNVATNAPSSVTNKATVSGGNDANTGNNIANDPTTITAGTQQTIYLTIVKSHSGNFTQGQTGAQYTITVKNTGTAPSSGTVTAVDMLPTGLTATAISGSGWSCTLSTLKCTRSSALAGGSSYPNITLTVNVASNASSSVTNTATVSGGGDQSSNDNTASDPTTITPTSGGNGAQLVPDSCDSSKTSLVVTGTAGNDKIELKADGSKVEVKLNSVKLGSFSPTGRVIVLGQAGNDDIKVSDDIKQMRIIYGGDGNDTIKDENGKSIMLGGSGDDKITGGDDRDIAIGGSGADTIKTSDRNDILVAGSTSYDTPTSANQVSLCSIQAEWLRTDLSYEARVSHINGTTSGGLNGANVLKAGQTVFDDTSKDSLTGGDEQDWFLLNITGSGTLDTSDRKSNEIATDL